MTWICVEDRIDTGSDHGRVIRKLISSNLFADKMAILSNNPIPASAHRHLNMGDKIAFYENEEIREGSFLCAFDEIDPTYILGDVLSNEDDLKYFCASRSINMKNLFIMVIEAFKYLSKIQSEFKKAPINHAVQQNRKRSAETIPFHSNENQKDEMEFPKQQKLRLNVENSLVSIDDRNPDPSGNNFGVIKFESFYDSNHTKTERDHTHEGTDILPEESIEIIDINQDKSAEQQIIGVNQLIENPEPTDKKIKIQAPPDREILNSLALQRAGTLEDPYLVYVSPGVRKLSVNYYFLIGGELFYATKRHSMRLTDKFGPERHKITVQCSKSRDRCKWTAHLEFTGSYSQEHTDFWDVNNYKVISNAKSESHVSINSDVSFTDQSTSLRCHKDNPTYKYCNRSLDLIYLKTARKTMKRFGVEIDKGEDLSLTF